MTPRFSSVCEATCASASPVASALAPARARRCARRRAAWRGGRAPPRACPSPLASRSCFCASVKGTTARRIGSSCQPASCDASRATLSSRLLARVGERVEVGGAEGAAALQHQPAGDGRVDAAREQQLDAAGDADGQAAGPRHDLGEDEGVLEADLDADGERRRVHVDRQRQRADDGGADGARDLHRARREALVAAARLDLEGRARVLRPPRRAPARRRRR